MSSKVLQLMRQRIYPQQINSSWKSLTQSYCTESDDKKHVQRPKDGYRRKIWNTLKSDFDFLKTDEIRPVNRLEFPRECDYVVMGAGLVGSAVAYWLKQRNPKGINVAVIERDYGYTRSSSMLSVGGIRHQFTQPENVLLSMFTTEFLRNIRHHLSTLDDDDDPPDAHFNHQGYLFLATEDKAEHLSQCVKMQREQGAKIELYNKDKLAEKFPWLNLDGIVLGSNGIEGEGWFDPWLLLRAFKKKNLNLGVHYVSGEIVSFGKSCIESGGETYDKIESVNIKDENGELHEMKFAICVNCAGPWAGQLAQLAGMGKKGESLPLPVEPRKRFVYVVHCPDGPPISAPLTVDNSGSYFRREGYGGHYLCGSSPSEENEPSIADLDVDYDFFEKKVWPDLAYRIPAFENLKLKSAWAGFYDYNYVDQNLIIGNHPEYPNFYFANGMSGHGAQQSVAIGRAIMELLIDDQFQTIDLTRFHFNRFLRDKPVIEGAIV